MLQSGASPTIANVVGTCGYYDQAHLNRELVDLAGCPPNRWMAEELPSVQDGDALMASSSTA